ncbi:hypothetical protein JKF63_07066 [Porcisia hertigi]|uniref:ABC transporter domain-containing protein n=1 Tax=Porcisia hertigi TaxID=2761500 RepID=A0A836LFK2_9TRYP|nr:hypothetical protein JKF63_07066 [Porcisia hertigi]
MGRRHPQQSVFADESRLRAYQRNAQISRASEKDGSSGSPAWAQARSKPEVNAFEYLDSEPNENGGTFNDKFLATIERIMQQKRRAWVETLLELLVPLFFISGAIIMWAAFGEKTFQETQELNYTAVSSLTIPDYYKFMTCNDVSQGSIPGLTDCATAGYEYNCSGDESSLPVKGLCFASSTGGDRLLAVYMNAILGNVFRVPSLDTVIMMQWIARKFLSGSREFDTSARLAASGLAVSNRYNAIMNSGMLYFAPRATVPPSLINCFKENADYFQYVDGGIYETVEEAENYVKKTPGLHWAIVEVKAFDEADFNVVLHMNATSLPPLTKIIDIQYPGGYSFDRADMYVASGFNSLQEVLYRCYLKDRGYKKLDTVHPYAVSLGYPKYTEKTLLKTAAPVVVFIVVLSFLYPVSQLTTKIVLEKELRIREAMLIMGLSNMPLYLSWFVVYALQYLVECILIVLLLKLTFVRSSDAFVLFSTFYLFAITTIPLSGLIAAFFSKARLASMLTPLIFFVLSAPTFSFESAPPDWIIGICVLSPTAFASALHNILTLEGSTGFGKKDFTNPGLAPVTSVVYILLAVDFCAYCIFMLYFDAVLPKDWGTTKHPLFLIIDPIKALSRCCSDKEIVSGRNEDGRAENGLFEDIDNSDATVRIEGLRKEYSRGGKTFVAVNNLYWSMNNNEISVLLGHNGAGKTTTMNMMTGMVSANAGDCYINGFSVRDQLDKVRQQIGYCPQYNILWDELTCREHLEFFGKIKGIFGAALETAVRLILNEVDLLNKIEYRAGALSGGQKRKLSVAIAFVGRSPLVFLDEPTAGMDVGARRYTWELLRRMSEAHTIMLTTHYMDEADLLGHKIGIMSRGSLQCSGSSVFLKSRLGVGYNMTVSIDPEVEAEHVDRLVLSLLPSAESTDFTGSDIVYKLSMRDLNLLPSLLAGLERDGEAAGIRGYSLSAATLEEVFLQIAMEDMERHKASHAHEENEMVILEETNAVWNCEMMTRSSQCLVSHFKYMMLKRLWNALRDRKMQCFQLVCPMLCILLAMLLSLIHFTPTGTIDLSSEMFGETVEMHVSGCESYMGETHDLTRQGSHITNLNFASGLDLSLYATDTAKQLAMPRYTSIFCGDPGLQGLIPSEKSAIYLFYNTSAYHSSGLVLQQLYTYILQNFVGDERRTLKMGAELMPTSSSGSEMRGGVQGILIGAIIMIPFTFLPSNPVAWIVKERECKARHLQMISGLSFYVYWVSNFVFDVVAYILTLCLVLVIFLIFGRKEYVGADTAGPTVVMFIIYGLCSTVGAYLVSFAFDEHSTAQSATMAISFVSGFLLVMMVFILSLLDATKDASDQMRWPFRLLPSYCVGESIINLSIIRQQALLGLSTDPWGMDVVGWPCVFMVAEFPIFLLAILFIDHPRRRMWRQRSSYDRSAPTELIDDEDSDVEDERKEVYRQEEENTNVDVVRVVDLRKVYRNGKAAVRNLSFSILPDEVFGFLGTNGAGKTTTMSILCQEFIPSSGNAYVCGYDIVEESEEALKCIGYCPQFDATLDLLTVEEHLYLYAGIRCIVKEYRSKVVTGLMRLCDILEYRHTTSAQLSGGNRRKLSVALSFIGGPRVVFLDEPSAGMDPVARRGLWSAIKKVSQNCSVVLTTHHLEEVEALADVVAIMADGALRCIGDKIHLKQKYGTGFEMSIRVANKGMQGHIQRFVKCNISDAVLIEFKGQRFVFALPQETTLSHVFRLLQENKERLRITDYSVSQTSIEQVFLRISEQQERREGKGAKKRVVHLGKSHAQLHRYHGDTSASQTGGTAGRRCARTRTPRAVVVSSAAIEAYRRRTEVDSVVDAAARSAASGHSKRMSVDDTDEDVETGRNYRSSSLAGSQMRGVREIPSAPSNRKRSTVSFTGAIVPEPRHEGNADPYSNTYSVGAQVQDYAYDQSYSAALGSTDPPHYEGSYSYSYSNGAEYYNGGASWGQSAQNPYNNYYSGKDTSYT